MWYFRRRRRWLPRRPVIIVDPSPSIKKAGAASAGNTMAKKAPAEKPLVEKPDSSYENRTTRPAQLLSSTANFALHMSKYKGQTVTVFVSAGGSAGLGFTGILYYVNDACIRLIINPGPAPACPPGNACTSLTAAPYSCMAAVNQSNAVYYPGIIATIPICKITAFVHNAI